MAEDDEPPLNKAIEDLLAHCHSPDDLNLALSVWLRLGAETMARECGRAAAMEALHALRSHIREADPSRPWPP